MAERQGERAGSRSWSATKGRRLIERIGDEPPPLGLFRHDDDAGSHAVVISARQVRPRRDSIDHGPVAGINLRILDYLVIGAIPARDVDDTVEDIDSRSLRVG